MFWLRQLVVGLTVLAEFHVVHRDIKLENILIDSEGNLVLIDFEESIVADADEDSPILASIAGTPMYIPPESQVEEEGEEKKGMGRRNRKMRSAIVDHRKCAS